MGLERHIDSVIDEKAPYMRDAYYWFQGMSIEDESAVDELIDVLNRSGEFGPATYNPTTRKIEFGIYEENGHG